MGLDAIPDEFWELKKEKDSLEKEFEYAQYQKGLVARDRFRGRDDPLDVLNKLPKWCQGCHKITDLRECWGCHKWFCYDCLIEHMMGCSEWQKIKGDYEILYECDKHETCDDCPFRFKCYTSAKKIPKKKK